MDGWMGKILFVDLGTSKIVEAPTEPYVDDYVGGRGIAARIYWEMADAKVKPFDPENPLIFMTGPLVASRAQAATVVCVVGKSPGALPESYCYGNIAGYVGAEIKRAGYDGLVVTGKAPRPAYLWIDDGEVEIREAGDLWGLGAFGVRDRLQDLHGRDVKFIVIGVSGENLVRTATAYASHESALSCGFGAVMGSKNLKGVAVRGSHKVSVADPDRLKELNRHTVKINQRLHLAIGPDVLGSGHGQELEVIGKGGCYLCGAKCIRNVYRYDKRLEGMRHCQTMEYYLPWMYGQDDEPVDTFFNAPDLANDYCIDTFELRSMINWLYACHNAGTLTEAETGLPLAKIGTQEFLENLLHAVAYRQGFGDLLAEGMARVATSKRISAEARAHMGQEVAPIGQWELQPPRLNVVHSLLYYMEPRVHQPLLHDTGFAMVPWTLNQMQPGSTPIDNKVFRSIAKAFWGSETAGALNTYEGKALAAKLIQNRVYLMDSLGLCDFTWPIIYSFATPDHVGDPDLEAKLFSAVTGRRAEELERCAEIVANLQRAILLREGRRVPDADYPQEYNFAEQWRGSGTHGMLVPGEGDSVVDMTGNRLDKARFTEMLKEYYRLRGWDEETGIPSAETLALLGLEDVASGDLVGGKVVTVLSIKELAEVTGVPRTTIHYYLRQGLLPRPQKTAASRSLYTEEHAEILREIAELKNAGLSLAEIESELRHRLDRFNEIPVDLVAQEYDRVHSRILAVAMRDFSTKGYKNTHVTTIMKELGITASVFYAHFPSKRRLLAECVSTMMEWSLVYGDSRRDSTEDPAERLMWLAFASLHVFDLGSSGLALIRVEKIHDDAELEEADRGSPRGVIERITKDFCRCPGRDSRSPAVPDELVAHSLLGAYEQTYFRLFSDREYSRRDLLRTHLWVFLAVQAARRGEIDIDSRMRHLRRSDRRWRRRRRHGRRSWSERTGVKRER